MSHLFYGGGGVAFVGGYEDYHFFEAFEVCGEVDVFWVWWDVVAFTGVFEVFDYAVDCCVGGDGCGVEEAASHVFYGSDEEEEGAPEG